MSIVVYMQDYNSVCKTKYEFCPRRPLIINRWNTHKTGDHDYAGKHNKSCEAESLGELPH